MTNDNHLPGDAPWPGAIDIAGLLDPALPSLAGRLTITVPEAGTLLGLGRGAAYAAARRGDIPTIRFGTRIVVPVVPLLEVVGLPVSAAAPTSGQAAA